jgi:hypothetical protein
METEFSRFIRDATPEEKEVVYMKVMDGAVEKQLLGLLAILINTPRQSKGAVMERELVSRIDEIRKRATDTRTR